MNLARDKEATEFERTEGRLVAWGYHCWENTMALGLPQVSGIAKAMDEIRAQTRMRKGVRKRAVQESRKAWKERKKGPDCKEVAEQQGNVDQKETALGKQSQSFRTAKLHINSEVLEVDALVSKLPGWMQKTIIRSYLYGQPDRRAAQDLRMPKSVYKSHRIAAIEEISRRLR